MIKGSRRRTAPNYVFKVTNFEYSFLALPPVRERERERERERDRERERERERERDRGVSIADLALDFTLPGHPEVVLTLHQSGNPL